MKEYPSVPVWIIRPYVRAVVGDGLLFSVTEYWEVAVDRNFGEVSIMRDRADRTAFLYSLGPEFYDLFEACTWFRRECLNILIEDDKVR